MPAFGKILGIDLGSNSLGTALIDTPSETVSFLGVRIFPAGVEGDLEEGKEESKAKTRRDARAVRRQTERRRHRLQKVFRLLQRMQLLPPGPRETVMPQLQKDLERCYPDTQVLPYYLRARALEQRLEPYELGRALYHLGQRRGFLSNRTAVKKGDDEKSTIKAAIRNLREELGGQTLGQYMASLNTHEIPIRNKPEFAAKNPHAHYTHRSMFEDEFERIWAAQVPYYPAALSDDNKAKLHYAIFHQRPLKDQSQLVGVCELEPAQNRAPLRLLAAQRFRVLGFVNNLRIRCEDGNEMGLTPQQRTCLLDLAERREKLTIAAARQALGIKHLKFTIEEGGETSVPVNLSATRLRTVLGSWWDELTSEQRDDLVEDIGDGKRCKTDEDVERCAIEKWHLQAETAEKLADVTLPSGYARFSSPAFVKLLPHLECGMSVTEAIREVPEYAERQKPADPLSLLPPVSRVLGEIRNPAVLRALTELRKTVNAIIRRYGKPDAIRIELARDLKKSKRERQSAVRTNREREALRAEAITELQRQDPIRFANPKGPDIEKYLLAKEARWTCPYTGQYYSFSDVFGENPIVDVEHIIPRSRCLDNSYVNKVLAYRTANIEKGDQTPHEWLHDSDLTRYEQMIAIVKGFDSRFETGKKLRRFSMQLSAPDSLLTEFSQRQLQETRYASKLACRFLGVLYGGEIDSSGTRRVFATAGQITAMLRRAWDLNLILNPHPTGDPEKTRADHRHHAIDALAVALTSNSMVQRLAAASAEADRLRKRRITLAAPFVNLCDKVRAKIEPLQVSHRPVRHLSGALHKETFYGRPRKYAVNGAKAKEYVHYRVPVTALNTRQMEEIVDPTVRRYVIEKANELGGGGNKFVNNWPMLRTRTGREIAIKRVRIRKVQRVESVGQGVKVRFVESGANHHAEVLAELNPHGKPARYVGLAVTLLEASERKRQGLPVVKKDHGPAYQFVCTLSEGDLLQARKPGIESPVIWKIRSVRESEQLVLTQTDDARLEKDIEKEKGLWQPTVNSIFRAGARKVLVSHLGEVIPARD